MKPPFYRIIPVLVFPFLVFSGCAAKVHTDVSSISHSGIPPGSTFFVALPDKSIESQKIEKIIKGELSLKGFRPIEIESADIIITFTAEMLGSKTSVETSNQPIQTPVYNPITGLTTYQTTGYRSNTYSTTAHHREIRIQFYDGARLRNNESDPLLWQGVGKSSGSSRDIIKVAPQIVASIFEEIGKDADSKRYIKKIP